MHYKYFGTDLAGNVLQGDDLKSEHPDMHQAAVKMGKYRILFPGGTRHINTLSTQ